MSFNSRNINPFSGYTTCPTVSFNEEIANEDLDQIFHDILNSGIHGICFSLYEEGQKPGDKISELQIRRRLTLLRSHCESVRIFSCTDGNELIAPIAKSLGFKTMVGAWLGRDKEKNTLEIDNLVKLCKSGVVDIAAVGNEVLYRKDLSEEELIDYIKDFKSRVQDVPVGYVDAYYQFVQSQAIRDVCDVLLINCYPFWEGTSFGKAIYHFHDMVSQVRNVAGDKEVIVTETGWPNKGETIGQAAPSFLAAKKYFIQTQLWAANNNLALYYFSSFDESWKKGDEGEVGAHWGLWDKHEKLKYGLSEKSSDLTKP